MVFEKKRNGILLLSLLFFFLTNLSGLYGDETNQQVVAVLNLKNLTQNKGYDFLEKTIAESLATSFQKSGKFRLTERQRLVDLLEEQKLVLSGLADQDISSGKKIGALIGADLLVLGSFSSLGDVIEINARLVKADTGEILLAEKTSDKMGDALFAKISDLGDLMVNRILNQQTGILNLDSFPQGAEVKINGDSAGPTPITGKQMKTGSYSATLVKDGYEISQFSFNINSNQTVNRNIQLEKKAEFFPRRVSLMLHLFNFPSPDYQPDWGLGFEYFIWNFSLGAEFGGNLFFHNYKDSTAPGKPFEETMFIYFNRLNVLAKYYFMKESRYVSPYIGGGLGGFYGESRDYSFSRGGFYYKALAGLAFLPAGPFSINLEMAYHNLGKIEMNEKQYNYFGDYSLKTTQLSLENFELGLGIQFGF